MTSNGRSKIQKEWLVTKIYYKKKAKNIAYRQLQNNTFISYTWKYKAGKVHINITFWYTEIDIAIYTLTIRRIAKECETARGENWMIKKALLNNSKRDMKC